MVDAAQGIAGVEAVVAIFIREDLAQGVFGAIRVGAELSQGQQGGTADAAVAVAHTGPVAVRQAQRLLERSGARSRLRTVIDDTLADALRQAGDPVLPPAARNLLGDLAEQVTGRIP